MPIFYQQDIDESTKLGVWKIEEEEEFFLQKVPLHRSITHPHKRLQHFAGRYLLKYLFPDFPLELILIADTRKPFLEKEEFHFSISHCSDYAAVIVSKTNRVGVDIEVVSEKVEKIKHKFMGEEVSVELPGLSDEIQKLKVKSQNSNDIVINNQQPTTNNESETFNYKLSTLIWSCKEAVFKWYGLGAVDFKEHIHIKKINAVMDAGFEVAAVFKKNEDLELSLHSRFFNDVCLSYVVT